MTRAATYARISKDDAKTGLGVERQQVDCEALAARRGWPIVRRFVDNSKSAYSGKRRPGYADMMAALGKDEIDTIVVYAADRLYRRLGDMVPFLDAVQAAGATVETVAGGVIDLTSANGRMAARLAGVIAAGESERMSERVSRQRVQLRAAGKPMGGWRKYGETTEHEVDEGEADFIRQAVVGLLAGISLRETTRLLNVAGSRTPRGNLWRSDSLKTMLLIDHPGIVSAADADQLERTLRRPENAITRGRVPRHLLSGILVCGKPKADGSLCNHKLVATLNAYRCPGRDLGGCSGVGIHLKQTDDVITRRVLGAFGSTRPAAFTPADGDVRRLAELRRRRVEVAQDTRLADDLVLVRVEALDADIAACEAALQLAAQRHAVAVQADALRTRWGRLSMDEKRTALRTVIERIVVAPCWVARKVFDSDRLDVQWVEVDEGPDYPGAAEAMEAYQAG